MKFAVSLAAISCMALLLNSAQAAEPIEGLWKTQSGETAKIAPCSQGYCITLQTGKHKGKEIGHMSGSGASYKGKITDPNEDKTYSGKAEVAGKTMAMSGCVFGGLICKAQNWTRK